MAYKLWKKEEEWTLQITVTLTIANPEIFIKIQAIWNFVCERKISPCRFQVGHSQLLPLKSRVLTRAQS